VPGDAKRVDVVVEHLLDPDLRALWPGALEVHPHQACALKVAGCELGAQWLGGRRRIEVDPSMLEPF
jgi:hypothetical protein